MKRRPALPACLRLLASLLAASLISGLPAVVAAVAEETAPSATDTKIDAPPVQTAPPDEAKTPAVPKLAVPAEEPLLTRPPGPILDQAHVFRPETAERLAAHLTAARAQDVWVYVLTVPTLRVLPSRQKEKLEGLAKSYAKTWLPESVGAVLIFDDEGGLMSAEISPEAGHRFSDVAIQIALAEPLSKIQMEGLSREKLDKSATAVTDILCKLQTKYLEETRRQRKANIIMGGIALLGLGMALWSATAGAKKTAPADPESEISAQPPSAS